MSAKPGLGIPQQITTNIPLPIFFMTVGNAGSTIGVGDIFGLPHD
jgi:hypothetical protein